MNKKVTDYFGKTKSIPEISPNAYSAPAPQDELFMDCVKKKIKNVPNHLV